MVNRFLSGADYPESVWLAHKSSPAPGHKTLLLQAPHIACHKHYKHVCLDRRHLSQATVYDKTLRHPRPIGAAARTQENFSSSQRLQAFPTSVFVPFRSSRYVAILMSSSTDKLSQASVLFSTQFQLQILPFFIFRPQVHGAVQVRCSQH